MSISFGSGSGSLGEFKLTARQGGIVGLLALLAFLGWGAAYVTGMFPWTGRESATLRSFGAGKVTMVGNTGNRSAFGFKSFYYLAGQEAVLSYTTDITAGGLRIYLTRAGGLRQRISNTKTVDQSGAGEITYIIPKSGLYRWSIRPTVTRGSKGYDLSYSASWGARPAS